MKPVEDKFKKIIQEIPEIKGYHEFRVVAYSTKKIIIIADIGIDREQSDAARAEIIEKLKVKAEEHFTNLATLFWFDIPFQFLRHSSSYVPADCKTGGRCNFNQTDRPSG